MPSKVTDEAPVKFVPEIVTSVVSVRRIAFLTAMF
jgi:hypothetical protein